MNVLNYLSISHSTSGKLSKVSILRLVFTTVVGLVLCLLSVMSLNETAWVNFAMSPWLLPTATFCLLLVLVAAHIRVGGK